MQRWDIIQAYIDKYNYISYLEVGYYKGWSFDSITCAQKQAVDPNPCKNELQQQADNGSILYDKDGFIIKLSSDEFFSLLNNFEKFDIIFIDGLHEEEQVYKDIQNALKHISGNGVIILHDCNPPLHEHTTTGIDGCWTGTAYKAFIRYRRENPGTKSFTIDTDWGVGVIRPGEVWEEQEAHHSGIVHSVAIESMWEDVPDVIEWEFFEQYRNRLLNLKTINWFKDNI